MDIWKAVCEMERCLFYCLAFWCSAHEKMHVQPTTTAKDGEKNTPLHGEGQGQRASIQFPVQVNPQLTHTHVLSP